MGKKYSIAEALASWRGANSQSISVVGFLLFSGFLVTRIVNHQLWRDEAQAWAIVGAIKSPYDLLVIQSEAHPPLWYWIIYLLHAIDSDVHTIKIAGGIFAVGTLALVWLVSKLQPIDKAFISLSYFLSWQYGVFSRSYILGAFLLLLFAILWPYWRRRPIIGGAILGLASLTHAFFAVVGGVLALLFIYDWWREDKNRQAVLFAGAFGILTVLAALSISMSSPSLAHVIDQAAPISDAKNPLAWIGYAFTIGLVDRPLDSIVGILFLIAFLPLASVAAFVSAGAVLLSGFQLFLYAGMPWHAGAIYILFVCVYSAYHSRIYRPVARLLLGLSALGGIVVLFSQNVPYSRAEEAAGLIRQLKLEEGRWISFPDYVGTATFAVLNRPYESLECQCEITFARWRERNLDRSKERFQERLTQFVRAGQTGEPSYMLVSKEFLPSVQAAIPADIRVESLAETGPAVRTEETFLLWKLTPR
jgi:hypothetical protein